MKLCREVSKAQLLTQAISLVSSAKEEIFATMHLDEESEKPLPREYHLLLLSKKRAGVNIVRFGYGSKKAFLTISKLHSDIDLVYRGSDEYYQRMLLVDGQKGMFSVSNKFYYTEFEPLVRALRLFAKGAK